MLAEGVEARGWMEVVRVSFFVVFVPLFDVVGGKGVNLRMVLMGCRN